ncbi:VanZ like family protein [Caloramator mitchellensis]|uniref:VanZ like family protein n=1 Tax=Caloramator mitchellensis TaxID=908809 RepID=A0A0R3JZ61_CALMK|nr:VanZ family protein [Caloramator mitchellensis]KRQ85810.1 VanZ like family protein [Caloramator mitchellensis]
MDRKFLKWVLVFIWAAIIFIFSSQNGEMSSENNKFILHILKTMGLDINLILDGHADFIIRKAAHFTEYFILYSLLFKAFSEDFSFKNSLIFSIIFTFLYSSSDEFHQSFVPGRAPSFKDVLIDTAGGVMALLLIYARRILRKTRISA